MIDTSSNATVRKKGADVAFLVGDGAGIIPGITEVLIIGSGATKVTPLGASAEWIAWLRNGGAAEIGAQVAASLATTFLGAPPAEPIQQPPVGLSPDEAKELQCSVGDSEEG